MKLGEELQRAVREPDFSGFAFPDQDSQRQIDPDGLPTLHQRRACQGVAEDQYLRWPQAQSDFPCFGGMVDVRKKMNSLLGEERFQALDCLRSTVRTWECHEAGIGK